MLIILLLLQAFLCFLILHKEIYRKKFANFGTSIFFSFYMVLFVVEPLILHVFYGGARSIITNRENLIDDFDVYIIFDVLGILLLSSSVYISYNRKEAYPSFKLNFSFDALTNLIGIIIILGLCMFVYSTGIGFFELFSVSRFGWTESKGFNLFFFVLSTYVIAFTPIYIYLFTLSKKTPKKYLIFFLSVISLIVYGILTKDRKWIFYIVSGWVAARFHKNHCRLIINKRIVAMGLVLFIILMFSQFLRDFLPRYFLNEDVSFLDELRNSSSRLFEFSDLSYFYRATIEAILQNYRNGFYIFLGIIRRVVFFFLPASFSGGLKIEDISAIFSDVVKGGDDQRRGSMPPGFFGIFVLSFGWFISLFIMPYLSLLLHKFDQLFLMKFSILQLSLFSLFITCVIYGFRGDESASFYFFIANFLFLKSLYLLSQGKLFKKDIPQF